MTDPSNAAVTGLLTADCTAWSAEACAALGVPMEMLPTIVDSTGVFGEASALPGVAAARSAGRRSAGQPRRPKLCAARPGEDHVRHRRHARCVHRPDSPGVGDGEASTARSHRRLEPRRAAARGVPRPSCCRPAPTSIGCATTSASSTPRPTATTSPRSATTPTVSSTCRRSMGLGTPHWDYGARGTLLGLTRGSGRPQLVRAVLEGVAHRGADLVEAAEADFGDPIAAHQGRWRHEPEPDVRPGAGKRHRPGGRGVPTDRGDHDRRRVPRRPRRRGVGIVRRHRRSLATPWWWWNPPGASIASSGPRRSNAPGHGYQTCRLSTSRIAPLTLGKEG